MGGSEGFLGTAQNNALTTPVLGSASPLNDGGLQKLNQTLGQSPAQDSFAKQVDDLLKSQANSPLGSLPSQSLLTQGLAASSLFPISLVQTTPLVSNGLVDPLTGMALASASPLGAKAAPLGSSGLTSVDPLTGMALPRAALGASAPLSSPTITVSLLHDTAPGGGFNTDGITSDPTLVGRVTNFSPSMQLRAGFKGTSAVNYQDVTMAIAPDGSFTLTQAQLNTLYRAPLPNGEQTLTLQAIGADGRLLSSANLAFTFDNTAPRLTVSSLKSPLLAANSRLTGTTLGTISEVASLSYHFDSLNPVPVLFTPVSRFDRAFDQAIDFAGVTNGSHKLYVTATDAAGNILTNSYAVQVTGITPPPPPPAPPSLSIALLHDTAPGGLTNTDGLTSDPTVAGVLSGASSVVSLVASLDGGIALNLQSVLNQGSFALSRSLLAQMAGGTLLDGAHALQVRATDGLGQVGTANLSFTLDSVAPTLSLPSVVDNAVLDATTHLTGMVDGTGSAAALSYHWDSLADGAIGLNNGTFDQAIDLTGIANGAHQLTLSATDAAGNQQILTRQVTVQVSAADVPLSAQLALDSGSSATDGLTNNPTIQGQITLPAGVSLWAGLNDAPLDTYTEVTPLVGADGSFKLDASELGTLNGGLGLGDGSYTVHLVVKDGQGTEVKRLELGFVLDTTPPDLTTSGLIDGIAWTAGSRLSGGVSNADPGTVTFYSLDGGTAVPLSLGTSGTFDGGLSLPQQPGAHQLQVTSIDAAGNQQQVRYDFLIQQPVPVQDDEELPPSSSGNPAGNGSGGSSGGGGNTGGGGNGGWSWGSGQSGSGGSGNPYYPDPSGSGNGYGYGGPPPLPTYLQKLGIGFEQAIEAINPSSSLDNLHRQAALVHRAEVLMNVGALIDRDGVAYSQMAPVFHGIYDQANDHPLVTVQDAVDAGAVLGGQLTQDTDAVKVQVFQAELLAAVNHGLGMQGQGLPAVDDPNYGAMVTALMGLARTYAGLNPTAATDASSLASPVDFLDSLWRAGKVVNNQPLDSNTIYTDINRGATAAGTLLTGVEHPLQAIQFVCNLVQAATKVVSLQADIHDAKFLRELVSLGFEYARLNPNATTNLGDAIPDFFLNTLWQSSDVTVQDKAAGEMFNFFTGASDHVALLQSEEQLLSVFQQANVPELTDLLHDPAYVDGLLALGTYYPKTQPAEAHDDIFYQAWKSTSGAQLTALAKGLTVDSLPPDAVVASAFDFIGSGNILGNVNNLSGSGNLNDPSTGGQGKSLIGGQTFGITASQAPPLFDKLTLVNPLTGVNAYWLPSTNTLYNVVRGNKKPNTTHLDRMAFFQKLLDPKLKPDKVKTAYLDVLAPMGALVHDPNGSDSIANILGSGKENDVVNEFIAASTTQGRSTTIPNELQLSAWIEGSGLVSTSSGTNSLYRVAQQYNSAFKPTPIDASKGLTYVDLLNVAVYNKLKDFILSVANRSDVSEIMLDDHFGLQQDYLSQAESKYGMTAQDVMNGITARLTDLRNSLIPTGKKLSISVNPFALRDNHDGSFTTSGTAVTLNNQDVGTWLENLLITGTLNVQIYRDDPTVFKQTYDDLKNSIGSFLANRKYLVPLFPKISISIAEQANGNHLSKKQLQEMVDYVNDKKNSVIYDPGKGGSVIRASVVGFDFLKLTQAK